MRPILFELGPFSISSLWFFVALGFLVAGFILLKMAVRMRLNIEFLYRHFFFLIMIGLVTGRILYVLANIPLYFSEFDAAAFFRLFAVFDQGISVFGFLGGLYLALWFRAMREKESIPVWFDVMIFASLIGLFFGHLGALLDGANYGRPISEGLPWGVLFETPIVQYSVPVHPTQLYAALSTLAILATLLIGYKKHLFARGDMALLGVGLYGAFLALEQLFRGDETVFLFGVRTEIFIGIALLLFSGIFWFRRKRQPT